MSILLDHYGLETAPRPRAKRARRRAAAVGAEASPACPLWHKFAMEEVEPRTRARRRGR